MNTQVWNYCYPNFEEVIFHNNTAINNGGAVYLHTNATPTFINNTFFQNSAPALEGGAIYCTNNCNFHIHNSILWQNPSPELFADESCIVQVHNCDLTNGDESYIVGQLSYVFFDGNILESDPMFVDSNNDDFNLEWNSPCIDMGVTVTVRTDSRNFQRNRDNDGTLPDIGAESYYQPDTISQPTDLTISTENDSIFLNWNHGDGAIFYKIYESQNPYSSYTVIDTVFGNTEYSTEITNNKNFLKITGGNNRSE